jgi:glucose-1-phosphate adenylyltransferase
VLSPGVRVDDGAAVSNAVILNGVRIGARAVVRNAILDKNIVVPPGATIGVDHEADRSRGFTVSPNGVVCLGKGQSIG